ncbi:MAG: D-2-hydroxyacid dehydrogenase [Panacagrimonas sp.]
MDDTTIYVEMILPESEEDLRTRIPRATRAIFSRDLAPGERKQQFLRAKVAYGMIQPDWLRESRNLEWLQLESAGIDGYAGLGRELWTGRIAVTNMKGFFAVPVAETLVAGVLALYRGIDRLIPLQAQRVWKRNEMRAGLRVLHGAHALILGAGSIGLHTRRLLQGFGCITTVYARKAAEAQVRTREALDECLPGMDLVLGCLPDTPGTRDLFDRCRLGLLKPTAVLANGGRGSLIDEVALVEMLQAARLGGAVLDVTRREPLPADDPLWQCPNTLLTQHSSGGSADEVPGKNTFFLDNLGCYLRGAPLANVVDLSRDY